ncbi:MAG TPA: tetratricopeptide repeat protein [Chitinophagaceae bacterium]|nr:tetratricopeptide repeat protein [Chitinophagaceae bacterium]
MSNKVSIKTKAKTKVVPKKEQRSLSPDKTIFPWLIPVLLITAASFFPMLANGFTNWDDELYVTQNPLLKGPDWGAMFTQAAASNYHPLTMVSFGINYVLSGFDPFSYHFVNWLLHILNTALVFVFIYKISGKKNFVAAFTAIIFGVHPMHVESVAWISERKDVLYAFFFLVALLQYWRFLETGKRSGYVFCLVFFVLSLLSKPAAIILPLVLLLLDYWKERPLKWKLVTEKIPFFLLSVVFGIITVKVQSADAIAGFDIWPLWTRFFFACYTIMIYAIRFIFPYPLSAFHPYPPLDSLGLSVYLSPLFMIALLALLWLKRRDRLFVFSILFFVVNLLLVIQLVSIGLTIVSERYTYIPYIGLAFLAAMLLNRYLISSKAKLIRATPFVIGLIFGVITFQRTKVWKDGDTLWADVIKHYPDAATPRSNHANYLKAMAGKPENLARQNELLQLALSESDAAIKLKPTHAKAYENRQNIYLLLKKDSLALADADMLLRLEPQNSHAYYTKGVVYMRSNRPDSALANFDKSLAINPNADNVLNNRGSLLFNRFQRYNEAIADFTKAIAINPQGEYFYHRSLCYYKLGDVAKARADALFAEQKGVILPESYKPILQSK